MIDTETILSVFDSKGTLLKWLKTLDETIQNSVLESVDVEQTGNTFKLIFTYANGATIESPPITIEGGASDIFVAVYNQTTLADIGAALALNKLVLCFYDNRLYTYASTKTIVSPPSVTLHFVSVEDNKVYMLNLSDTNGWTTSSFELQNKLESGVNIKKINGNSILGSGNMNIGGGGGTQLYKHKLSYIGDTVEFVTTNNTAIIYDSAYQAFIIKGIIITCTYVDDGNGARWMCLPIDRTAHSSSECYCKSVYYYNGSTWITKTINSDATDTVTAL